MFLRRSLCDKLGYLQSLTQRSSAIEAADSRRSSFFAPLAACRQATCASTTLGFSKTDCARPHLSVKCGIGKISLGASSAFNLLDRRCTEHG